MKKLLKIIAMLFACIAISAGLAACSSDDDEPDNNSIEQELLGAWIDKEAQEGIFFDKNGMGFYVNTYNFEKESFRYTVKGKTLTLKYEDYTDVFTDITVSDDILYLVYEDGDIWSYKRTTKSALGL